MASNEQNNKNIESDSDTESINTSNTDLDSSDEEITDPQQVYSRFEKCEICDRYMIPDDVDADWDSVFSGCCFNEIITNDPDSDNEDVCKNCQEEIIKSYESEDEENYQSKSDDYDEE